ncbi:Zinc finger C2H2 [Penicillium brevicompactum]|uniref:Zinc finger C2H2 n=1 Tax=Penicillium brevicompactum TaxID=5074 RepID=A0A9W9QKK8_PENBR|nr:Zinc finger C2H2 [Penicillium brevicompactum]
MSRTSSVQGHSPAHIPIPDPYLSTTCDPEEISFQASAIRLTPSLGSPHSNGPGSSPHDPTVQTSYLDAYESNISACASPLSDVFVEPREIELDSGSSSWRDDSFSSYKSGASAPGPAWSPPMAPSAFQFPNAEHNPVTSTTLTGPGSNGVQTNSQPGLGVYNLEPARLAPSVDQESNGLDPGATRGRSPVFKITKFTRGDSPEGGASHQRRPSQSTAHLSAGPNGLEDEDEENEPEPVLPTSSKRESDGTWLRDPATNLAGIGPASRGDEYVPSPNDVHVHRVREERNEDITSWSVCVSQANSEAGTPSPPQPRPHIPRRLRARSTGDHPLKQEDYFNLQTRTMDRPFLGPGVLVHESSDELSENESVGTYSNETSAEVDDPERYDRSTPEVYSSLTPTKADESIRLYPWHDPPRDSAPRTHAMQPDSSTDAMIAFEKRVRDLETASLAATVDNNSIFNVTTSFENFSLGERGNREQPKKRTSLLKRPFQQASSMLKRQASEMSLSQSSTYPPLQRDAEDQQLKQSYTPRNPFSNRRHSRSPSLSNALMAMTSQIASVGGSQSVQAVSPAPSPNPERSSLNLPQFPGRGRSRSEIPRPTSPGLINLMTAHGGPPVPNITSPRVSSDADQTPGSTFLGPDAGGVEDEHDADASNNKGLVMDFPAIQSLPVPTLEGFKSQIMQLNPRLEPALIHRLAHEQDRRFKVLVGLQQKHAHAVANHSCKSGNFCFALGGKETPLQDTKAPAETKAGQNQFHVSNFTNGHEQGYAIGEGTVAAAQFPPGVPLPPVSRLPARFECPICFQVKTFTKPSDWSKHVQEDVHPFTCTFPHCTEPKSFKRKADWVRHENEKHRHLEWWTCAFPDCSHTCYRKDNFVQHLVREHKMPEPKTKKGTTEPNGRRDQNVERIWQKVEECRHETKQAPQSEPCRFCGNVCSEWRKLSVHLGKHLEQLAMPVLRLSKPSSAPIPADEGRSAPLASYETSLQPQYATQNTILDHSISGIELSTEPESMTESLDYPYLGAGLPLAQAHPLHQNSTYPPPYAAPRPRSPEPDVIHSYPVPQFQVYPADYYQPMESNIPYTATYSSG